MEGVLTWPGLRMLLALAAFYTAYRGVVILEELQHISRGVVYFIVAAAMLVVAQLGLRRDEAPADASSATVPGQRLLARARARLPAVPAYAWWAMLAVAIGVGIAYRIYLLSSQPFGLWFDEAQIGLVARQILDDRSYHPIFIDARQPLPALFFYVWAFAFKVGGQSVTTLRSVPAIAGILTLPMLYLLARELFDHRVAVLSTFFLAVMRWHINFSRFAVHGVLAPLFMVAMFYFLVRGLKGKGFWNFIVAGVMAGVGLQTYFSFLLVPFIAAFYLAHHALLERELPWRALVLGAGAVIVATAIVYSPVAVWAYQHQDEFNERANTLTVTKDRSASEVVDVVYDSTKTHLLMFNSRGDSNGRHNLSGAPMLDRYTGFLFVLGAGLALWRVRHSAYFLLIVWVVVTLQGGIWSVEWEAPQAYRTLALTPAIAMLAALPLSALWDMAGSRHALVPAEVSATPGTGGASASVGGAPSLAWYGRYAPAGLAGLVLLFVLAQAAYHNYDTYFNKQLNEPRSWTEFNGDTTFVARELDRLGSDHRFLASSLFASPVLEFVYPPARDLGSILLDPARDLPLSESRSTVVFLDHTKAPFFQWLHMLYPGAQVREVKPPGEGQTTLVYEMVLEPEEIDRLRGVEATYRAQDGDVITRREPKIDFDWTSSPPAPFPFAAQWTGQVNVTEYGDHELSVQAPGRIILHLDGEVVAEGEDRVAVTRRLFRGRHQFQLEVAADGPGRVVLSDNGEPLPDSAYFAPSPEGIGLLATFYTTADWSGEPTLEQLDPFVGFRYHAELPFGSPFSAIWRGQLRVPLTGPYLMEIRAVDRATVLIDGLTTFVTPGASAGEVRLTEGLHDLEVRFTNANGAAEVYLYWTRPGGQPEVVPSAFLYPP